MCMPIPPYAPFLPFTPLYPSPADRVKEEMEALTEASSEARAKILSQVQGTPLLCDPAFVSSFVRIFGTMPEGIPLYLKREESFLLSCIQTLPPQGEESVERALKIIFEWADPLLYFRSELMTIAIQRLGKIPPQLPEIFKQDHSFLVQCMMGLLPIPPSPFVKQTVRNIVAFADPSVSRQERFLVVVVTLLGYLPKSLPSKFKKSPDFVIQCMKEHKTCYPKTYPEGIRNIFLSADPSVTTSKKFLTTLFSFLNYLPLPERPKAYAWDAPDPEIAKPAREHIRNLLQEVDTAQGADREKVVTLFRYVGKLPEQLPETFRRDVPFLSKCLSILTPSFSDPCLTEHYKKSVEFLLSYADPSVYEDEEWMKAAVHARGEIPSGTPAHFSESLSFLTGCLRGSGYYAWHGESAERGKKLTLSILKFASSNVYASLLMTLAEQKFSLAEPSLIGSASWQDFVRTHHAEVYAHCQHEQAEGRSVRFVLYGVHDYTLTALSYNQLSIQPTKLFCTQSEDEQLLLHPATAIYRRTSFQKSTFDQRVDHPGRAPLHFAVFATVAEKITAESELKT